MKIKFNTRKSIISLIIILAMCSSIFMISASALSVDSTAPYISEELLAEMTKAIAEEKGVSVDDIEVRITSVQQISVDELSTLQNHNHVSLYGSSPECCWTPIYYYYTAEVKEYTGNTTFGSDCYNWADWHCVTCQNCWTFKALAKTGAYGFAGHTTYGNNYCVQCCKELH